MNLSKHLKLIFIALISLLLLFMLFLVPQYGISGDEVSQYKYGIAVWDYLKTFGADKTAVSGVYLENTQTLYGGFFDGFAAMLIDIFHPHDPFLLRHYWNMIFGFAGIVFGGLLAKELAGWRAAILVVIFFVFTPRFFGQIFNNPKDIPFATGYIAALLCSVRWLKALEKPSWKTTVWLGLSIALAVSVRIGGILVIAYLGMFYVIELARTGYYKDTKILGSSLKHLIVAVIIGWLGACLWWPYALEGIISHPIQALKVMSDYPLNISTLFQGVKIRTTEIPPRYLPVWISIGTPLYILAGAIGSLFFIPRWTRDHKNSYYILILFATLFPVGYIIYKKSVVYDGMRHILFVLPLISLLAALFFDYLLQIFSGKKIIRYAIVVVLLLLIALPARFMFANHPNEYVYFNELTGGIKGAYGNYETDYYFNSIKGGFDWLLEHKLKQEVARRKPGDSVIVASNAPDMLNAYKEMSPVPFKFVYVRYYQRDESDWDYGVFMSRFLDKEQLQSGYFPGDHPLHLITADGIPLTTVLQNDPQRNALKGFQALEKGDNEIAVTYLKKAAERAPKDAENWRNLAVAALQMGDKTTAENAIKKAYSISSLDISTANTAGIIYLQINNFNAAANVFGKMTNDYPDIPQAWLGLGQAEIGQRQYELAMSNINKALMLDPRIAPRAYMALAYIYQQKGDYATAQKYRNAAQQAVR